MDIKEALDIVVGKTKHERFRQLCDPNHSDYNEGYIPVVIAMAEDPNLYTLEQVTPPSLLEQAANAAKAAWNFTISGFAEATPEQKESRLSICRGCEYYESESVRCMKCGCFLKYKTAIAGEACPLSPPKWGPIVIPSASPGKCGGCGNA